MTITVPMISFQLVENGKVSTNEASPAQRGSLQISSLSRIQPKANTAAHNNLANNINADKIVSSISDVNNTDSRKSSVCENPLVRTLSQFRFCNTKPKLQLMSSTSEPNITNDTLNNDNSDRLNNSLAGNEDINNASLNNIKSVHAAVPVALSQRSNICDFEDAFQDIVNWDDCIDIEPVTRTEYKEKAKVVNDDHIVPSYDRSCRRTNDEVSVIEGHCNPYQTTTLNDCLTESNKVNYEQQKESSNGSHDFEKCDVFVNKETKHPSEQLRHRVKTTSWQPRQIADDKFHQETSSFLERLSQFKTFSDKLENTERRYPTLNSQNVSFDAFRSDTGRNKDTDDSKPERNFSNSQNTEVVPNDGITSLFNRLKSEFASDQIFRKPSIPTQKTLGQSSCAMQINKYRSKERAIVFPLVNKRVNLTNVNKVSASNNNLFREMDLTSFEKLQREKTAEFSKLYNKNNLSTRKMLSNATNANTHNQGAVQKETNIPLCDSEQGLASIMKRLQNVSSSTYFSIALEKPKSSQRQGDSNKAFEDVTNVPTGFEDFECELTASHDTELPTMDACLRSNITDEATNTTGETSGSANELQSTNRHNFQVVEQLHENQNLRAIEHLQNQQHLPITVRPETRQLPITKRPENQQLPITERLENQQLPITEWPENHQPPITERLQNQQDQIQELQQNQRLSIPELPLNLQQLQTYPQYGTPYNMYPGQYYPFLTQPGPAEVQRQVVNMYQPPPMYTYPVPYAVHMMPINVAPSVQGNNMLYPVKNNEHSPRSYNAPDNNY